MIHAAASPTLAQVLAPLPDAEGDTLTMVIAVGLIVVTGLPAVINPKRTHLT